MEDMTKHFGSHFIGHIIGILTMFTTFKFYKVVCRDTVHVSWETLQLCGYKYLHGYEYQ